MSLRGLFARYGREKDDWYVEEEIAVESLLQVEDLRGGVYDPCAGIGTIPRVCERNGIRAIGSDRVDRLSNSRRWKRDVKIITPVDFLAERTPLVTRMPHLVFNPPYATGMPEAFVARALRLSRGKVCAILPFTWYSGNGRRELFAGTPLARVHCFAFRINMPPGRLLEVDAIEPENGKQTYAWFVWDKRHPTGCPATLHRIEKRL